MMMVGESSAARHRQVPEETGTVRLASPIGHDRFRAA